MIVGFPGETEEDFRELLDFVREVEFDWLGAFPFSDEEDAESYGLTNKVDPEVCLERRDRLLDLQRSISRKRNQGLVGSTHPILVEGPSKEIELLWQGRLSIQAPEIDGVVYLNEGVGDGVEVGGIYQVHITEAHEYDLVGTLVT
jgi:ribosomal protein S12 methylthiotransferase